MYYARLVGGYISKGVELRPPTTALAIIFPSCWPTLVSSKMLVKAWRLQMKLDVFIGNDNYLKKERKKYTHRHTFTIIKNNNDLLH